MSKKKAVNGHSIVSQRVNLPDGRPPTAVILPKWVQQAINQNDARAKQESKCKQRVLAAVPERIHVAIGKETGAVTIVKHNMDKSTLAFYSGLAKRQFAEPANNACRVNGVTFAGLLALLQWMERMKLSAGRDNRFQTVNAKYRWSYNFLTQLWKAVAAMDVPEAHSILLAQTHEFFCAKPDVERGAMFLEDMRSAQDVTGLLDSVVNGLVEGTGYERTTAHTTLRILEMAPNSQAARQMTAWATRRIYSDRDVARQERSKALISGYSPALYDAMLQQWQELDHRYRRSRHYQTSRLRRGSNDAPVGSAVPSHYEPPNSASVDCRRETGPAINANIVASAESQAEAQELADTPRLSKGQKRRNRKRLREAP